VEVVTGRKGSKGEKNQSVQRNEPHPKDGREVIYDLAKGIDLRKK